MKAKIEKLLKKTIKKLNFPSGKIEIFHPSQKNFGDYTTNLAFFLAQSLKKSPLTIAEILVEKLKEEKINDLEKIEAKGGYINFFLSPKFFLKTLNKILEKKDNFGKGKKKKKKILIDFSSPNIAKSFAIAHLRSTIIGQALINIYKFLGYEVLSFNHLGDWGTQFGNLIFQIKREKVNLNSLTLEKMEKLYIKFHNLAEKNQSFFQEGKKWFQKLAQGDKEAQKIWKVCKKISLKEFAKIYKILKVKFDFVLGESFFEKRARKIAQMAFQKKLAHFKNGALIFEFAKENLPPQVLLKSDGQTTYFLRDLAAIEYRLKKFKPNLIVYQVGSDQKLYFKQLFLAAQKLFKVKKEKFFHSAHGLILTKEGKFSTRKGRILHLEDVLKEGILRAKKLIPKSQIKSESKKEKIAKIIGIGAIKYNDLKQHPSKDILFSWEKVLSLKGNSCPYLQYTALRAKSILKKVNFKVKKLKKMPELEKEESDVLREIYKFEQVIREAGEKFSPNLICDFAFDLSQKFNLFYEKLPILKSEDKKDFRLLLTLAFYFVLKNSLFLLGIDVPEKM